VESVNCFALCDFSFLEVVALLDADSFIPSKMRRANDIKCKDLSPFIKIRYLNPL
jgi:hypothetical protein